MTMYIGIGILLHQVFKMNNLYSAPARLHPEYYFHVIKFTNNKHCI